MNDLENSNLGNFGFLLDYDQEFLFMLGQQAESYLYTNLRLSAVFVRQLTEAFFDTVIDDLKIDVWNQLNLAPSESGDPPTIFQKQKALVKAFASDSMYRSHVFPRFPLDPDPSCTSRVACPLGEGDDRYNGCLVDENTLYVWNAIRRVGNAGAHTVDNPKNKSWLKTCYVQMALKELCNRMFFYFAYRKSHSVPLKCIDPYHEAKSCYGSGQTLFACKGQSEEGNLLHEKNGILPAYTEDLCVSVVPVPDLNAPGKFRNVCNRYALVRAYRREGDSLDLDIFLVQSQRVFLALQQQGSIPGIPDFSVLADLRAEQDYYVTAYYFNARPQPLTIDVLFKMKVYDCFPRLLKLFLGILRPLEAMCTLHVYHRTLTHCSIRLLETPEGDILPYVIDFETCKLFEKAPNGLTVYSYAAAEARGIGTDDAKYRAQVKNLKQYNHLSWDPQTTEAQYRQEVLYRTAAIFANILCPRHLEPNAENFNGPASIREILSKDNAICDQPLMEEQHLGQVKALAEVLMQALAGELDFNGLRTELEKIQEEMPCE